MINSFVKIAERCGIKITPDIEEICRVVVHGGADFQDGRGGARVDPADDLDDVFRRDQSTYAELDDRVVVDVEFERRKRAHEHVD